jgi:hypothetical protein
VSQSKREQRRAATGNLAAGGALIGAASGGNALLERDLRRSGRPKVVRALRQKKLGWVHARRVGGKIATTAARTTGIPLAAYGAYNLLKPDTEVHRVNMDRDVVRPVLRNATMAQAADKRREAMAKADLQVSERKKLVHHKKIGRDLSLASGTMGLTALALRGPRAANYVARKVPKAANGRLVRRLAQMEPHATAASDALVPMAIGTGAVGSFNYAAQQKLEAKQQKLKNPEVVKKDRFLRTHSQNISTDAERGYRDLKHRRNVDVGMGTGNGTVAGLAGIMGAKSGVKPGNRLATTAYMAGGLMAGIEASNNVRSARGMQRRMNKIKAKAYQRAAVGELGRDRVAKSLVNIPGEGAVFRSASSVPKRLLRNAPSHASLGGVSAKNKRISRKVSEGLRAVRAMVDSPSELTAGTTFQRKPVKHMVGGHEVSRFIDKDPGSLVGGYFPAGLKPGQSQRHADAIVFHPKRSPMGVRGLADDMKNHELAHVRRRKPLSAVVRTISNPTKGLADEARANQAMRPKNRRYSAYERAGTASNTRYGATRLRADLRASGLSEAYRGLDDNSVRRYREVRAELDRKGVGKALLRIPKINYTRRIGAGLTTPRPRVGGLTRSPSGKISTRHGSMPGTRS